MATAHGQRILDRKGRSWTMHRWEEGVVDSYGDTQRRLDSGATVTAVRLDAGARQVFLPTGEYGLPDVRIYVDAETTGIGDVDNPNTKNPVFVSPEGVRFDGFGLNREPQKAFGVVSVYLIKRSD